MKIALVHNHSLSKTTGGAERTAFKILEHLKSSYFEVVYCTLGKKSDPVSSHLLNNGVRHYEFPNRNPFYGRNDFLGKGLFHFFDVFNLRSFLDFWKVADKECFSFVFFHNPKGFSFGIWLCAVLQKIPFCLVNHDYYNICINSCFFKRQAGTCKRQCFSCSLFRFFPWLLHFFSEFAIFLSSNQRIIFQKQGWFLRKKTFIVPPLIDSVVTKPKSFFTKKVGFIGRLDSTKGVDDFLELCRLCDATDIRFYIQAFSSDPNLFFYKSKGKGLKNLNWARKSNLSFLREMDFLVVPSKWEEPFGRVFLESLSCGTPCIGYPRGAIHDIMHGDLRIFIADKCEINSIRKMLLHFYKQELFYSKYSRLCQKRYLDFIYLFRTSLNAAIRRV